LIHCKNFCKCHNVNAPGKQFLKSEVEAWNVKDECIFNILSIFLKRQD
jgi:hypothetical protein